MRLPNLNKENWIAWLRGFKPAPLPVARREKLAACAGALFGLMLTQWVCHLAFGEFHPWFVAPMGASAVLMFALPSSPLAQPWAIVGGNMSSAIIGVLCAQWISDPMWAAGLAVPSAIAVMFALRCLHPPGGAVALLAVLGKADMAISGPLFVLVPVGANSALLLISALVFNNLLRRRYPHPVVITMPPHRTADPSPLARVGVTRDDIDAALREHRELLDVQIDDIEDIVLRAELHAFRRHAGSLRCRDIMSRDVVTVMASQPLHDVWHLLQRHHVKALPVVDEGSALVGIISWRDLLRDQEEKGSVVPMNKREREHPLPLVVAQRMTHQVRTARPEQALGELVTMFCDGGFHHMPVIDEQQKVIGMITQSDLIAALYREGVERAVA